MQVVPWANTLSLSRTQNRSRSLAELTPVTEGIILVIVIIVSILHETEWPRLEVSTAEDDLGASAHWTIVRSDLHYIVLVALECPDKFRFMCFFVRGLALWSNLFY